MTLDQVAFWVGYAVLGAVAAGLVIIPAVRCFRWFEKTQLAEFTVPVVARGIYLNTLERYLRDRRGRRYVPRFFGFGVFRFYVGVLWVETEERL